MLVLRETEVDATCLLQTAYKQGMADDERVMRLLGWVPLWLIRRYLGDTHEAQTPLRRLAAADVCAVVERAFAGLVKGEKHVRV